MMTALWQRRPAGRASMHWSSTSATYSHPSTPRFFNTLYDPFAEGADFVRGYPFSWREGSPTALSHGEHSLTNVFVEHATSTGLPGRTSSCAQCRLPVWDPAASPGDHAVNADFLSGTQLPPLDIKLYKVLQLQNLFTTISLARPAAAKCIALHMCVI